MRTRLACMLAMAGALGTSAAQAQAPENLWSGDQIRSAWSDKKLFARSPTAGLLEMRLRSDGTAEVSAGNVSDSGQWRVTDKAYCVKWQKIRKGEERCFGVAQRGDKVFTLGPDGAVTSEILRVID